MITDRTQADVSYANANRDNLFPLKGAYNAADYNRVGIAFNYLSNLLYSLGYGFNPILRTDWTEFDNFMPDNGMEYLSKIKQLRESFVTFPTTPPLPIHIHELFRGMGFVWANNIELMFVDIEILINHMISIFRYSGELISGEDNYK